MVLLEFLGRGIREGGGAGPPIHLRRAKRVEMEEVFTTLEWCYRRPAHQPAHALTSDLYLATAKAATSKRCVFMALERF